PLVRRFPGGPATGVQPSFQEPVQLREKAVQRSVTAAYIRPGDVEIVGVDEDIQREWARQRDHLEKTVSSLKVQQAKDSEQQQQKNLKLMRENTSLIQEINELRKELQTVRTLLHSLQLQSVASARKKGPRGSPAHQLAAARSPSAESGPPVQRLDFQEEAERIIQLQRTQIHQLRQDLRHQESAFRPPPASSPTPTAPTSTTTPRLPKL
ncbi:unnamed protein product, partial [Gadus morhua 'NCC']